MVRRYINVSVYVRPDDFPNGMEQRVEIVLDLAGMELTFPRVPHVAICFYV